jgi:hypothetical protein
MGAGSAGCTTLYGGRRPWRLHFCGTQAKTNALRQGRKDECCSQEKNGPAITRIVRRPYVYRRLDQEAYELAVLAIDQLINDGAINHTHPQSTKFMQLFDAIYAYEKIHFP